MGQTKHKMSYTKIYHTWARMISRCRNQKDPNYKNYGERGISVCKRWQNFENFYQDMGEHPFENAQIDRIDNDKGYFKENCRWSTPRDNCLNRRSTKKHKTHQGNLVQIELIKQIGWTKNQFTWYRKRYGLEWILKNFQEGTLPKKQNREINRQDIVGRFFGKWQVIKFFSYTKKQGHLYECQCKCGIIKNIPRNNLMRGKTTQCRSCAAFSSWHES